MLLLIAKTWPVWGSGHLKPCPAAPGSRELTFLHLVIPSRTPCLSPVWFASPSWVWPCELEFLMVPIIPFRDEFFCKSFPWGAQLYMAPAQVLPRLFPNLPKLFLTAFTPQSNVASFVRPPTSWVMLVSHGSWSSEDQPVCVRVLKIWSYIYWLAYLLFSYSSVCFRKTGTRFVSFCISQGPAQCLHV